MFCIVKLFSFFFFKAEKQELMNQINENASKSSKMIESAANGNKNSSSDLMNTTYNCNTFSKGRIIHNYSFNDKCMRTTLTRQASDRDIKHYSSNDFANYIANKPTNGLNKTYSLLNEKQTRSAPI